MDENETSRILQDCKDSWIPEEECSYYLRIAKRRGIIESVRDRISLGIGAVVGFSGFVGLAYGLRELAPFTDQAVYSANGGVIRFGVFLGLFGACSLSGYLATKAHHMTSWFLSNPIRKLDDLHITASVNRYLTHSDYLDDNFTKGSDITNYYLDC
jgi:hypothetical protein